LTINGGSITNAGLLTGASGGTGVADKGMIYSVAADLTFGTGYLLLNDDIDVGASGHVYNTGATLGLINPVSVTGNYTQTGGGLYFGAASPSSYAYLDVSNNASVSGATIALSAAGAGLAAGQTFILVHAGATGTYVGNTAFLPINNGLLAQLNTVNNDLVLTLATDAEHHYWDGSNTAATGTITGGTGTWTATGTNWTSTDGTSNGTLSSTNVRPVFGGTAGTVTVDTTQGAIDVAGMQFSTDGYRLTGGSIGLTAAASAFEVDDNVTATIDTALNGTGGLAKTGNGMLILNGVNTYAGGTTVDAGTLEIGDADHATASILGNVTVNTAGTLRGHGTVDGSVANNGTVRPGGSIGTLTITGDYTQTASGTLFIDVSPTAASQLNVGGTATLGGTLNVLYGPGTYSATSYRIINAASTTGRFASVVSNAPANLAQSVQSLADGSELTLAAATDPGGSTADGEGGGGAVVVVKPTNATIFGALGSAAIREGQRVNETLLARLGNRPAAGGGSTSAGATDAANGAGGSNQVWTQLVSNTNHVRGNSDAPSYKDSHYGFLAGLDHQLGDWTVGVAGGYSHIDVREDQASGKIDTVRLAGYGARYVGPVNVAATLGAAYDFIDSRRGFGELGDAKGNTDGQEFTAGLQASLPLATGPVIVTPRVGLRYQYFHAGRFGEDGPTSQDLDVDSQNLHSLQPYAQFAVGLPFNTGGSKPALAEARVGYAYETLDRGRGVDAAAADGTRFALPGTASSRGMLSAGLGLTMPIGKSVDVTASYDRLFKTGNTSAQAFQLQATYRF
jgi:outer membrane autotransporter protein